MARERLIDRPASRTVSKIPTVEVVDLTSDEEPQTALNPLDRGAGDDASLDSAEDEEQTGDDQWESGSLYEDALEELEDDRLIDGGEQVISLVAAYAHCSFAYCIHQLEILAH